MEITYAIWRGNILLSMGNIAHSSGDILSVLADLNNLGGSVFSATVTTVKAGK